MRHSLFAAVLFSTVTSLAVAQTGAPGTSGAVRPGSQSTGDAHEKQTTPIDISKQSGTASGQRGDTGTRGSDSDSSITGRSRSPDIAYGNAKSGNVMPKKTVKAKKSKTVKHHKTTVSTPAQ